MTKHENNYAPMPQGKYHPATRHNGIIYTSGMTPRQGGAITQTGKLTNKCFNMYKEPVEQATFNALVAAQSLLVENEVIKKVLMLKVYINTTNDFKNHSSIADFASEYLSEIMGAAVLGSRVSIGVSSLPGDAPVEIYIIAAI